MILVFIFGSIAGILIYSIIIGLIKEFSKKNNKKYSVTLTISYSPNGGKKFLKLDPIQINLSTNSSQKIPAIVQKIIKSELQIDINKIETYE